MDDLERSVSLKLDLTFRELHSYFLDLFKERKFSRDDYFTKTVFFLEKDREFHDIANQKSTINVDNALHSILARLSTKKSLFNQLHVPVGLFCEELAFCLYSSHIGKQNAEKQIGHYNACELQSLIEEKIKFLKKNTTSEGVSVMEMELTQLQGFPVGSFTFSFVLSELIKKFDSTDKINTKMSLFEKVTDFDTTGEGLETVFPKIIFTGLYLDLENSNKVSDNKFSGSSFSGFSVNVYNNNGKNLFAQSDTEFLFNIVLAYLEKFCETGIDSFCIPWKVVVNRRIARKVSDGSSLKLHFDLTFRLNDETRVEILQRTNLIFKTLLENKSEEENAIKFIINEYFPDSAEDIEFIFEKNAKDEGKCCDGCVAF